MFNTVAAEYGLAPVGRCVDLLAGRVTLIVGTPETDPVSSTARVTYVGPIVWQRGQAELPGWVSSLNAGKPVVWVYSGNPRYAGAGVSTACDSIVVIRAAIRAFADAPVHVVLTSGFQEVPAEVGTLPPNFHHAAYLPGRAMAERCQLMVYHGGHSSVMQSLAAGTPSVIIPTITERESNARRLVALGAGAIVMPAEEANGEKQIDVAEFSATVRRVLGEPGYGAAARRIAESMRGFGGAEEAANRIEGLAAGAA
jgi:MGT family glycosyltransferase